MPVILPRRHYTAWLTAPAFEADRLRELLVPFDATLMKRYPVGSLVNKPQNNTPGMRDGSIGERDPGDAAVGTVKKRYAPTHAKRNPG